MSRKHPKITVTTLLNFLTEIVESDLVNEDDQVIIGSYQGKPHIRIGKNLSVKTNAGQLDVFYWVKEQKRFIPLGSIDPVEYPEKLNFDSIFDGIYNAERCYGIIVC